MIENVEKAKRHSRSFFPCDSSSFPIIDLWLGVLQKRMMIMVIVWSYESLTKECLIFQNMLSLTFCQKMAINYCKTRGRGAQIKDLFTLWQIWNKVSSYIKVNSGTWPSLSARNDPRREVQWPKSLKYSGKLQV